MKNEYFFYTTLARAIALTGNTTSVSINGYIGRETISRTFDNFTYIADPRTQAVEVYFDGKVTDGDREYCVNDPFLSIWDDGKECRYHYTRYNFTEEIWKHLEKIKIENLCQKLNSNL